MNIKLSVNLESTLTSLREKWMRRKASSSSSMSTSGQQDSKSSVSDSMDNFCLPVHSDFAGDSELWRTCSFMASPSPPSLSTSTRDLPTAASLRTARMNDKSTDVTSSHHNHHSQYHHYQQQQQQQQSSSHIDDISHEPLFSFSARTQSSSAYNEFSGVRESILHSPVADALLSLKHAVVHTSHSGTSWMSSGTEQLPYSSDCPSSCPASSYQSAVFSTSPTYDRGPATSSPFPFVSSQHHERTEHLPQSYRGHQYHQQPQPQPPHGYHNADSQDASPASPSSTTLYNGGTHRPVYRRDIRDLTFGSSFVHDFPEDSPSFPSMSVNLSMCMNVDVTTHDQLLHPQRGYVVGRHGVNSASNQFRDDPWAKYPATNRPSPPASLIRYRRAVSPVSDSLQSYSGRGTYSAVGSVAGHSYETADDGTASQRIFTNAADSAAAGRMLQTSADTQRHHHHHHQHQYQVPPAYRSMAIPRYTISGGGGLSTLRRRTGTVGLGFRARSGVHQPDRGGAVSAGGTTEKANLCRICGRTYARPSTLKTHMRTHSGEKPYVCTTCRKSFSQAANLTAHARTHSGEKPFRCPVCDRSFSQSSSVTTHLRTHSGERPYRCRLCKKTFSDSSTLTKHLRIHSGEKPYQCKVCMLRFSQSGNLNRHMRVHFAV